MEDPTYKLFSILIFAIVATILMIPSLYLIKTIALISIPVTAQETNIELSKLQLINQTYGNNPLMQSIILQAQSNITAIANLQILGTTQVVNKLSYTYDLFHNLSSIKDFLEIFAIPLIMIIISAIIIIYIYEHIYKRHKNSYL